MSLEKTKKQLIHLLGRADSSVIALSGKWGTGKTHLWNEVKGTSKDKKITTALYVSLFGLSNVDQIKRKLIEASIPSVDSHGGLFDGIKNLFRTGISGLSAHYKALAAINDLNVLLMAPLVLRNKVVVIDDIERKHEKLGIDEVLGFIDEYSKQYKVRFVLVLNDDQLSDKGDQEKLWATFREKVIDQEIKLSTSFEEAFSIAIALAPSKYAETLKRASVSCRLTNIRIIVKVIKAANLILAEKDLEETIRTRVVPSIVLFSAIHYRGLEDGPDFKFVLNINSPDWADTLRDPNSLPNDEDGLQDRWRMLIRELGISGCDEFERVLVEFLESGLFEADKIDEVIKGYLAEKEKFEARKFAKEFLKRAFWDHRVDDVQLVTEAAALPNIAGFLDPFVASELNLAVSSLPNGMPIGKAIIDSWIAAFRKNNSTDVNDDNPFNRPLNAEIEAEFVRVKTHIQANASVIDACTHIIENDGWGTYQEVVMKQATAADFESAIREMDIEKLRSFMRGMIKMRLQRARYDTHFGTATERFVEACRTIANDAASPRLAGLIKRLFDNTTLASELNMLTPNAGKLP